MTAEDPTHSTARKSEQERPGRSGEGVQSLYEHLRRRQIEDSANHLPDIDEHSSGEQPPAR